MPVPSQKAVRLEELQTAGGRAPQYILGDAERTWLEENVRRATDKATVLVVDVAAAYGLFARKFDGESVERAPFAMAKALQRHNLSISVKAVNNGKSIAFRPKRQRKTTAAKTQ